MKLKQSYQNEEKLNAYSHGLGVLFSIIGSILLVRKVGLDSGYATIAVITYSFSALLLFTASTLYHSVSKPKLKDYFHILDHTSIYILIAGTYTPVTLITLEEGNGWLIFYVVWGVAFIGAILKLFFTGKYEAFSLLLYLIMGWLIIFDYQNLIEQLSSRGLILLALGGAFYTLGIFFYAFRRISYNHLVWHIFVLGGAVSHWLLIYCEVV